MSDAPERIWAIGSESPYRVKCSILDHSSEPGCTEYIRADLASPTPSLPEDAARVVDATMQAIVDQCVKEKLFLGTVNAREVIRLHLDRALQSLSSQLVETRAELKMLHTHNLAGRDAIEADRDRLAAELERKVAVAKEALEKMAALYESEYDADAPFNRPDWLRAALASLEDRA